MATKEKGTEDGIRGKYAAAQHEWEIDGGSFRAGAYLRRDGRPPESGSFRAGASLRRDNRTGPVAPKRRQGKKHKPHGRLVPVG